METVCCKGFIIIFSPRVPSKTIFSGLTVVLSLCWFCWANYVQWVFKKHSSFKTKWTQFWRNRHLENAALKSRPQITRRHPHDTHSAYNTIRHHVPPPLLLVWEKLHGCLLSPCVCALRMCVLHANVCLEATHVLMCWYLRDFITIIELPNSNHPLWKPCLSEFCLCTL